MCEVKLSKVVELNLRFVELCSVHNAASRSYEALKVSKNSGNIKVLPARS